MNYLHSLKSPILHCDLRSPNILIYSLDIEGNEIIAKVVKTKKFSNKRDTS